MFRSATAIAAAMALLSASQASAAATTCMTQPELRGMVSYVLPSVMGAVIERCRPSLPSNAAMLTRGSQLVGELQAGQSAAFPMARQAFSKFSGSDGKTGADLFNSMPEEALKPIIESMMAQELTKDVKTKDCADIDRVFATLQPLPARNFVELVTQVLTIAGRDNQKMSVCAG
ncbi:MAG: hypothetical protein ACKOQM_03195 [Novosphingobium sp.]